jgi:cytolethal distending toxin subunit A
MEMAKHRIRTIGALMATIAATAGTVLFAPAASADPVPPVVPGTLTFIVNYNSHKCLTIAGGGTANNVYANQYDCDTHPSREWFLVDRGNNTYWIRNYNSSKCLTIAGASGENNVYANQYYCDGHPSRLWYFVDRGYSNYQIVNYYTGKCLTIAGASGENNVYANQYNCDYHPARLWYFVPR